MKAGVNRTDLIAGLVLFLFSVWYGIGAWRLPRVHLQDVIDSHVYPLVLAVGLGLLSLGLLLKSLWSGREEGKGLLPSKEVIGQIIFLFAALTLYILCFQKLGYLSSTLCFMVGILKFLDRKRSLLGILLLSLVISGVCYGLFVHLFKIQVPPGIFI